MLAEMARRFAGTGDREASPNAKRRGLLASGEPLAIPTRSTLKQHQEAPSPATCPETHIRPLRVSNCAEEGMHHPELHR